MRRLLAFTVLALAAVLSGCGSKLPLPSQVQNSTAPPPSDKSYAMLQTWTGMDGIQDIVLTPGSYPQLFMVFNTYELATDNYHGGKGIPTKTYGRVELYPTTKPEPLGSTYFQPPKSMFNPISVAIAESKLYVLDAGDSCEARWDVVRNTCEADPTRVLPPPAPQNRRDMIRDYSAIWRVREYNLVGGDTLSTFTDTTFASVRGIAADGEYVYVSGIAALLDTSRTNPQDRTRTFASRIFRYLRGPKYPGIPDPYMPGCNWHRDTTWFAYDGTGISSVSDPRGIALLPTQATGISPQLVVADKGNNSCKTISVNQLAVGFAMFDGRETGSTFDSPEDATIDQSGFLYVVDRNNKRVMRYDQLGNYIQKVNIENNSSNLPLLDPITVGANQTMVYIGDRGRGQVIRYLRRP